MKYIFYSFIIFILSLSIDADTIFPGIKGRALIDSLRKYYKSYSNLGYNAARDTMYGKIDKKNDSLECVYSGYKIYMDPSQDPSSWAYNNDINCEHTWPQSLGADTGLPEGDIHHLFPTEVGVNSDRGSLPFGDIDDNQTDRWYYNNNVYYSKPTTNIDEYSERLDNIRFETREKQKGRTARAMFYFYTMYEDYYLAEDSDTSFFNGQKWNLYLWHTQYPADNDEINRTYAIADYQENKPNPFVLDSTLIRRAFFPEISGDDTDNTLNRVYVKSDFNGNINIYYGYKNNANIQVKIFDIMGRIIFEKQFNGLNSIDLTLNKNGKYFLIIKTPEIQFTHTVIIIK